MSEPFRVDNTPPEVTAFEAKPERGAIRLAEGMDVDPDPHPWEGGDRLRDRYDDGSRLPTELSGHDSPYGGRAGPQPAPDRRRGWCMYG